MNNSKCDICGSTEKVSNTWYGSILCERCEIRTEQVKNGIVSEEAQNAESVTYASDYNAY